MPHLYLVDMTADQILALQKLVEARIKAINEPVAFSMTQEQIAEIFFLNSILAKLTEQVPF